jgi:hypothetical protein
MSRLINMIDNILLAEETYLQQQSPKTTPQFYSDVFFYRQAHVVKKP